MCRSICGLVFSTKPGKKTLWFNLKQKFWFLIMIMMLFKLASNILTHMHPVKLPGTIDTNADNLFHDVRCLSASHSKRIFHSWVIAWADCSVVSTFLETAKHGYIFLEQICIHTLNEFQKCQVLGSKRHHFVFRKRGGNLK